MADTASAVDRSRDARLPDRIVLEMSLKPFKEMGADPIRTVCRQVLHQWHALVKIAHECSILFWVADGSEILIWKGDLEEEMEWARYIGFCNSEYHVYQGQEHMMARAARHYMGAPPAITYGDLREIIATFKEVASTELGLTLTAGATFDPGPEFAHSPFKYRDHSEIIGGGKSSAIGPSFPMVRAWSRLKGDSAGYAGYPNGIPDGTSFGEFLGRQSRSFMEAMGFDYIWLSNGFGFSHFAWSYLGENFNGESFGRADYGSLSDTVLSYWRDFKRECPDFPVEVRGTNFSMGMDLASDLCPYRDIYNGGFIRNPPPNSPWGPLNNDYGLELTGYMSRIAVLPEATFPFRFYPNDPWFWQNPWWDWYDRQPFDIYIPLSVCRIGKTGQAENPKVIAFLTIDTEKGELNERCPLEIIPHIRRAIDDFPDQAGPLTWLYPFNEYHDLVRADSARADQVFFGDWFIRSAVNAGLPLNTVLPTDNLKPVLESNPGALRDTILLTPIAAIRMGEAGNTGVETLKHYIESGGRVLFYGPTENAPAPLRALLNLSLGDPLTGEFGLRSDLPADEFQQWPAPKKLLHEPAVSGGPIREVIADKNDGMTCVWATVSQGQSERTYALTRRSEKWQGGIVGWIRGSNPFSAVKGPGFRLAHACQAWP